MIIVHKTSLVFVYILHSLFKSLQAVDFLLDIERIRQQAALHKMLEEIGIPRLFSSRNKTGTKMIIFKDIQIFKTNILSQIWYQILT